MRESARSQTAPKVATFRASANAAFHNDFMFIRKNEFLRYKAARSQHSSDRLNIGYKPAAAVTGNLTFHKSDRGKAIIVHHSGIQSHIRGRLRIEFVDFHSVGSRDGLKYQTACANR